MEQAPLRQPYPLEVQLHQEMIAALDKCMVDDGITADGTASRKLVDLATKTSTFLECIGLVLTSSGMMARIDRDILDEIPVGIRDTLAIGWVKAETAMRRGPAVR